MIRPGDLAADRDRASAAQAAALEQSIDDELRRRYDGPGRPLSVGLAGNVKRHVVEHVAAKYREAGWSVRFVAGGQRDGDSLEFSHAVPDRADER